MVLNHHHGSDTTDKKYHEKKKPQTNQTPLGILLGTIGILLTKGPHLHHLTAVIYLTGQPRIEQGVECVVVAISTVFG